RQDERGCSLVPASVAGRTALSKGRQWTPSGWPGDYASRLLRAAMVQPVGSWHGRCTFMTQPRFGISSGSIWALRQLRMRLRYCASVICWRSTIWGGAMLDEVNHHLAAKGIRITTGMIVDATIIH